MWNQHCHCPKSKQNVHIDNTDASDGKWTGEKGAAGRERGRKTGLQLHFQKMPLVKESLF